MTSMDEWREEDESLMWLPATYYRWPDLVLIIEGSKFGFKKLHFSMVHPMPSTS